MTMPPIPYCGRSTMHSRYTTTDMINCIRTRLISSLAMARNILRFVFSMSAFLPPITASEYALYLSWKCISTRATKITVAEILVNMAIQVAIS